MERLFLLLYDEYGERLLSLRLLLVYLCPNGDGESLRLYEGDRDRDKSRGILYQQVQIFTMYIKKNRS